jgi:hypothetical protein
VQRVPPQTLGPPCWLGLKRRCAVCRRSYGTGSASSNPRKSEAHPSIWPPPPAFPPPPVAGFIYSSRNPIPPPAAPESPSRTLRRPGHPAPPPPTLVSSPSPSPSPSPFGQASTRAIPASIGVVNRIGRWIATCNSSSGTRSFTSFHAASQFFLPPCWIRVLGLSGWAPDSWREGARCRAAACPREGRAAGRDGTRRQIGGEREVEEDTSDRSVRG